MNARMLEIEKPTCALMHGQFELQSKIIIQDSSELTNPAASAEKGAAKMNKGILSTKITLGHVRALDQSEGRELKHTKSRCSLRVKISHWQTYDVSLLVSHLPWRRKIDVREDVIPLPNLAIRGAPPHLLPCDTHDQKVHHNRRDPGSIRHYCDQILAAKLSGNHNEHTNSRRHRD